MYGCVLEEIRLHAARALESMAASALAHWRPARRAIALSQDLTDNLCSEHTHARHSTQHHRPAGTLSSRAWQTFHARPRNLDTWVGP